MKDFHKIFEFFILFREISQRVLGMYEVMEFIKKRIKHDRLLFFDQNIKEVAVKNNIESYLKHFNSYPHMEKIREELIRHQHYIKLLKSEIPKQEYSALSSKVDNALEALFSVWEGYAEFYTEKIGKKIIPDYERVESSLKSKKGFHPFLKKEFEKIKKDIHLERDLLKAFSPAFNI